MGQRRRAQLWVTVPWQLRSLQQATFSVERDNRAPWWAQRGALEPWSAGEIYMAMDGFYTTGPSNTVATSH